MSAKILVVDDEVKIVDILTYNLKREGYEVLTAHDGEAGLRLALRENPDLVLLDIMMPRLDGYEVCKRIREVSQVPIIMLTARADETDKVLSFDLGADDYVVKPFGVRELLSRVMANLRRRGVDVKKEVSKVISSIKIKSDKPDTYLSHLINFDFKSLWTTNYDCVIENVMINKLKSYVPIYKYKHFKDLSYPGECFLFKINGSCDSPDTIVITKEDFIEYRKSHEAYLILLKRELLCHGFLFLGCSFDDDILRICIKDILSCIENSKENYSTNHFAILVERNKERLNYVANDLVMHYNVNCLCLTSSAYAYMSTLGISCRVKYNSIYISGAKNFERHTREENDGKKVCQSIVNAFMEVEDFPFKFICGMGMSIGNFIAGPIKYKCKGKNLNRYIQMEPFPFTSKKANDEHRRSIVNKASIFLFLFGDYSGDKKQLETSGMWAEYQYAKNDINSILIPLPCGKGSMSNYIFENELLDEMSFVYKNHEMLKLFNHQDYDGKFYEMLVSTVILTTRKKMDYILDEIVKCFNQ
jgi:CheY-like chemotaxis protein